MLLEAGAQVIESVKCCSRKMGPLLHCSISTLGRQVVDISGCFDMENLQGRLKSLTKQSYDIYTIKLSELLYMDLLSTGEVLLEYFTIQ